MEEIYVGNLYQELLVGLNGLIEKTVDIQKVTPYNNSDYREALKFQIELEKTKLRIMETLGSGLETKLTKNGLIGYGGSGRKVFEINESGDIRFGTNLDTVNQKEDN
ncbi:hypothetical protein [Lysinibacillus sp. BPa_S21]|uniref:hypothetical protein n=1 Tax=Lysinibacillus sp. BPa_S21 TaxID=2932478 RepID=UPI0020137447|nr:hypothetical protein [Lysinibacillus sp. BPa_S21]MCL1696408.1 hypothetical protein [Lysinibacillus sp. BPa_S21]